MSDAAEPAAAEAIGASPIFSGLEKEDLEAVARGTRRRRLEKGAVLFSEGEEAAGFYLLETGRVKVFKITPDGREQILHFIPPGETFAEVALFSGSNYPATAQAIEPSRVIYLPRESLLKLVERNPRMTLNLLAGFAGWVRKFNRLVSEYAKEVPSRLAGYLLAEALTQHPTALTDGTRVRLAVTKTEIAAHLGTVGETLSRALAKLRERGAIETADREIVIRDLSRLRDIASGHE